MQALPGAQCLYDNMQPTPADWNLLPQSTTDSIAVPRLVDLATQ
jgi:hypothetical protein